MHPAHSNIAPRVNSGNTLQAASIYALYASHFSERKDSGK
jgi:hypothetical protein